MAAKEHGLKLIKDQVARLIAVTVDFVAYDFHFAVHLFLRIGAAEDNVSQQVGRAGEIFAQNNSRKGRLLLVGKGIQVAPDALQAVGDLPRAPAGRTLEREVLQKVGQAGIGLFLVASSGFDDVTTIEDVGRPLLTDDAQAVGQSKCILSRSKRNRLLFLLHLASKRFIVCLAPIDGCRLLSRNCGCGATRHTLYIGCAWPAKRVKICTKISKRSAFGVLFTATL